MQLELITQRLVAGTLLAVFALTPGQPTMALIVEGTGATVAPVDDPGWDNFTVGGRDYIYLGDGWAMSARHVGPTPNQIASSSFSEKLTFSTGSFGYIRNQAYLVPNPCYGTGGCITPNSQYTDLQLVRIDGDPGLPSITIASQPLMATTPIEDREVVMIGRGKGRHASHQYWNATQVPGSDPPNDAWSDGDVSDFNQWGYGTFASDAKRWGANHIADDTVLSNQTDSDLRFLVTYGLSVGDTDVVTMATIFDEPNPGVVPTNEAQAVNGDSGTAVFHKRDGASWELIGVVNGVRPPQVPNTNPAQFYDRFPGGAPAIYGAQTFFADLTYYHDAIMDIMTAHADYSVIGDINLDGEVKGNGTDAWDQDDLTAFVAGWGYVSPTGGGTITSWKNGDLNRDGTTNEADYELLADALPLPGDYNNDHIVDAADYTVWRNSLGEAISLPHETVTIGSVTNEDYVVWKDNFGNRIPTLAELLEQVGTGGLADIVPPTVGGLVPEPSGAFLALVGAFAVLMNRRRCA